MRCLVLTLALVLAPQAAPAQGFFRATPVFAVAQVYDSNLFSSSFDRQADLITRVTPGIEFEYHSARWTVSDGFSFDLERFAGHPELKGANARQHAAMSLDYRPTRRLSLAAGTEFSNTHAPSELTAATGLIFGRAAARRITANSAMRWQLNRVITGAVEYRVTEDRIVGGLASRTHAGIIRAERHTSSRGALNVRYHADQSIFGFEQAAASRATSHALTAGWSRAIARRARLSIDAGPRITNGRPAPEMSGLFQYRTGSVDLSLAYSQTQTTIIGLPEMARTRSVTASTAWTFRRLLDVRISPAYFRSAHTTLRADVYRLAGDIAYRIADGVSIAVALERNVQHGNLYAGLTRGTIPRQTVTTRLVMTPNTRS